MGGKVWSTEEERVFWEVVVPVSPNAANPAKRLLSWAECVELMKREIGGNARREYTQTMLYEHHYQNFKPGAKSPKANPFLEKHLRDIEWFKENKTSPPPAPAQAPASDDPLMTSLLNEINNPKPRTKRGRKATPAVGYSGPTPEQLYKCATGLDLADVSGRTWALNQGGRNSRANSAAATTRHTVANSYVNSAAKSTANSASSLSSAASTGQRKLPRVIRRHVNGGRSTQIVRQPTSSQALTIQPRPGPNTLLGRQPQSFGSGTQGMAPGARQDVRRTQDLNNAGTANQAHGSSSYVPFYQSYTSTSQQTPARAPYQTSTQAPRQSAIEATFQTPIPRKDEQGPVRLPPIRELFPFTFTGPEQEAFARREADAMLLARKRSISVEDEQMSAPKRRPLPDHPTPRQN